MRGVEDTSGKLNPREAQLDYDLEQLDDRLARAIRRARRDALFYGSGWFDVVVTADGVRVE
jgi:hypothetical protein